MVATQKTKARRCEAAAGTADDTEGSSRSSGSWPSIQWYRHREACAAVHRWEGIGDALGRRAAVDAASSDQRHGGLQDDMNEDALRALILDQSPGTDRSGRLRPRSGSGIVVAQPSQYRISCPVNGPVSSNRGRLQPLRICHHTALSALRSRSVMKLPVHRCCARARRGCHAPPRQA